VSKISPPLAPLSPRRAPRPESAAACRQAPARWAEVLDAAVAAGLVPADVAEGMKEGAGRRGDAAMGVSPRPTSAGGLASNGAAGCDSG
jgi:hypothetical protein